MIGASGGRSGWTGSSVVGVHGRVLKRVEIRLIRCVEAYV